MLETGGMLSHGAIVAREYSIPAVTGVVGACNAIKNGTLITVDGGKGRVEILVDKTETNVAAEINV